MDFTIKLTSEHVNTVFAGLDELQHKTARRAFDTILQQVQAQEIAAKKKPPEDLPSPGLSD